MRRYKGIICIVIFMCVFLPLWFIYLYRNPTFSFRSPIELGLFLGTGAGYNWIVLHESLYLLLEFCLSMQIIPQINEQSLTRMTRREHWNGVWKNLFAGAAIFCVTFCAIHLLMTFLYVPYEILFDYDFVFIWGMFLIRMLGIYMVFNGIFALAYSFLLKKEYAIAVCAVFQMLLILFSRYPWASGITRDMEVYNEFYSSGGLDVFQYFLDEIKHVLWVALLYIGSVYVFEKKDILNGKKL